MPRQRVRGGVTLLPLMAATAPKSDSRATGFADFVLPVADVTLNWLLRNYVGMRPRRPQSPDCARYVPRISLVPPRKALTHIETTT